MIVILVLLYLALTSLQPWEFYPELAELRLPFWLGNIALPLSVGRFLMLGPHALLSSPELHLLVGFFVVLTISPVLATGWMGGTINAFMGSMVAIVGCMLIFLNADSKRKFRAIIICMCLVSITLVVQAVAAYHWGWEAEKLLYMQGTDGQDVDTGERVWFGRVRGLGYLNDPNDLSQALIAVLPWFWPAWKQRARLRNFLVVILPSAFLVYGIFLTRSRGAVLSILFIVIMRSRERMTRFRNVGPLVLAGCLGVGMMALGVTGGREISADEESAEGRLDAWHAGIEMLRSHPLTGVGYGGFAEHHVRAAHNSYVHCFSELGLLGYFCWIGLLVITHTRLAALGRLEETDEDSKFIVTWATSLRFSLYGFLAGAFFLSRTYTPTLYILIALAMALDQIARVSGNMAEVPRVSQLYGRTAGLAFGTVAGIYVLLRVT